jgi:thioredoxin reductase (NADPH)
MFTGIEVGGQLTQTTEVENYPGYPNGIQGPEMMEDFRKQAERMGTDIRYEWVSGVDFSKKPFVITVDERDSYSADAVIISTGATAKWLGLESEKRLNGYGVSACAVCDGFFYKNTEVALVGAGDTACEEALYLSKLCTKVHMIVRGDKMRASKVMQERVLKAENIEVYWNTDTLEILGEKGVTGARFMDKLNNKEFQIPVNGFFVAIGHKPNSDIFKPYINTNENGYIITQSGTSRTNVEGVFASGDVQDFTYRQAVTAAGSGCMAALDCERWLAEHE